MPTKNAAKPSGRHSLEDFEENVLSSKERADLNREYAAYRSALMRARNVIAETLSSKMRERGIRYEDLTRELGLSRTTLSRLLNGTGNPTLDTLFYVASYLDLRLDFVFTFKDEELARSPKSRATKRSKVA